MVTAVWVARFSTAAQRYAIIISMQEDKKMEKNEIIAKFATHEGDTGSP